MTNDTYNAPRRKDDVHPDRELTWTEPAPAGAQLTDVMIDTETAGTTPGSAILSIGAVMFGQAGLGEEFYAPISLASCTAAGLTIDPGTIAWWMKQSDAARAAAFRDDAEPLPVVLQQFAAWFSLVEAERPWCQGANFDAPLLEAAYRACGMTPPWKFWNVRDTRTLYEQADVKVDRAGGTHHNALDDARAQAEAEVIALQRLHDARGGAAPASPEHAQTDAARDVLAERRRQVEQEGRLPEHDDEYPCGEIAAYAAFYVMPPAVRDWPAEETGYGTTWGEAIVPENWTPPQTGDRRRELIKAGALILAEIERIDRAAVKRPTISGPA